jgi:hypothetical protein
VKKKISIAKLLSICLLLVVGSLAFNTAAFTKTAAAAGTPDSCTAPTTSFGTDTMSVYVPTTATYTIWTRMQAATNANSIQLNIDNTNCYNVGGDSSIPTTGSWDWVDDYDGNTANLVNVSLSQGTHSFKLTGSQSGISIDRLIAVPVTSGGAVSCTPTNTQVATAGDNCAPLNNTASAPPTVSVTAPAASATVSGTTTISASATDSLGIASVQFELDGSALGSPIVAPTSGSTYSTTWNTTSLGNNTTHTISAIATDTSGYTSSSSTVSVTVNNSSGGSGGPSTPTVTSTAATATSVSLSWAASSDSSGSSISGYHVYQGGTLLASPNATTYTDSCLTPNTSYSFTNAAFDAAGHTSATSAALNVKTETQIGDLDSDNTVTGHDLSLLLSHYGTNWAPGEFDCTSPTSSTNTVEGHDLSILLSNYGK